MVNSPPLAVRATRAVAAAALLALVALCIGWETWLAPLRPGSWWLAVKALPLLPALPGLLRLRMFTYRWVSLLVWLYFAEGMVRATSERPPASHLAWLEAMLALVLFTACAAHVRLRQRNAALRQPSSGAREPAR